MVVVYLLTIPLFGQQAQFVALRAAAESNNKRTNAVVQTKKEVVEEKTISSEGITVGGWLGDQGWIENTGIISKRVRVVRQILNTHNGAELTISMHYLKPGEKVRIPTITRETVFYIYSVEGGLLGFMKANELPEKPSWCF